MIARFYALPRWVRDIVPLVFWMTLIFALSSQSDLVEIENKTDEKVFYKISHVVTYAILAWLWWRALSPQRLTTWSVLFTTLALTILYAISDEYHQSFVPDRHAKLFDVLFDTSGALAMILFIRYAARLRYKFSLLYTLISI